jgi:hypothetical protein
MILAPSLLKGARMFRIAAAKSAEMQNTHPRAAYQLV